MRVHKDVLLACCIAGIGIPKDAEIPADSQKMFDHEEKLANIHSYLERVVPHITLNHVRHGLQLCWWKTFGNGLAVVQNLSSGKLILMKNTDRSIASAVDALVRLLNCSKLKCPSFWERERGYPSSRTVEAELEIIGESFVTSGVSLTGNIKQSNTPREQAELNCVCMQCRI